MQEQEHPQAKVLTTPELVEIILIHLDTRTLLVSAQHVCQAWGVLIQSSPALQQALFLQPTALNPKWQAESTWNSILPSPFKKDTNLDQGSINESDLPYPLPIYNPLLVQAFRPFFPPVHEYPPIHNVDENSTESSHEGKEEWKENRFSFKLLDMLSSPQKKTAYMRKEASWRKMFLRQPPVYGDVAVFKMHHAMGGDSCICYKARQKTSHANHGDEREDDDDILSMGHFLMILTQNSDLYFGHFGQTRIYWSAHVPSDDSEPHSWGRSRYPPQGGSRHPPVQKAFAKAIEKSEIVIFSRAVIQCSGGEERELTDEEILREDIAKAESEGSKGVE